VWLSPDALWLQTGYSTVKPSVESQSRFQQGSTVASNFRHEEVDRMVGEILAILAVLALCLLFIHEVGSPYHR